VLGCLKTPGAFSRKGLTWYSNLPHLQWDTRAPLPFNCMSHPHAMLNEALALQDDPDSALKSHQMSRVKYFNPHSPSWTVKEKRVPLPYGKTVEMVIFASPFLCPACGHHCVCGPAAAGRLLLSSAGATPCLILVLMRLSRTRPKRVMRRCAPLTPTPLAWVKCARIPPSIAKLAGLME
jgi:hypothetical protein